MKAGRETNSKGELKVRVIKNGGPEAEGASENKGSFYLGLVVLAATFVAGAAMGACFF